MTTVTLPPFPVQWLESGHVNIYNDAGQAILNAANAVFQAYGANDPETGERIIYTRQAVYHGTADPVRPASSEGGTYQMYCTMIGPELGEAGAPQFRFMQGNVGLFGYEFVTFDLSIHHPWPMGAGDGRLAIDVDLIEKWRTPLWVNGRLAWIGLKALAMGGITPSPAPLAVPQDQIHIGPGVPVGPRGGMAGWSIPISVQL